MILSINMINMINMIKADGFILFFYNVEKMFIYFTPSIYNVVLRDDYMSSLRDIFA